MSVSPVLPQRNSRTARTRESLFDAAAKLFVARGYESTTMADIAAEAGTSRRTAFNYFPSKGDIPMLWVRQMADHAVQQVMHVNADARSDPVGLYFRVITDAMEAEPELSRQMMLGWTAALGPIVYESQLLADLTLMLKDGQDQGQIDRAVDVAVAACALSDVVQGVIFRWVRETDTVLHQKVDSAIALVLRAVTTSGGGSARDT